MGKADGAQDGELSGYRWTELDQTSGPWSAYGIGPMLAYDTHRDEILGIGPTSRIDEGVVVASYDREQNAWAVLHGWEDGPGWLKDFAVAYDGTDDRVLLFGGQDETNTRRDDLWVFQGGTWSRPDVDGGPSARQGASMVHDPDRDEVILYGGYGPEGWTQDLWAFSDGSWQLLSDGSGGPSPRGYAALAYDPTRGRLVMSGGQNGPGLWVHDTWEWDEEGWHAALESTLAYRRGAMVFDPALAEVVGLAPNNMQRYDGTHAAKIETYDSAPPQYAFGRVVYDHASEQLFAFTVGQPRIARIVEANLVPVFEDLRTEVRVSVTRAMEVPVRAHDPEGVHLELTVAGLPNGASFDGRDIHWTPSYDDVGIYDVTVTASDGIDTLEQVIEIEVVETTYDFLPEGDIDFSASVSSISCIRSVDAGSPHHIVEKHGWGGASCTFSGRNPGLIVAQCTAEIPVLVATQWGYTADAITYMHGESPMSDQGSVWIHEDWDNANSFGVHRGELSLGIHRVDEHYEASASVRYSDWNEEQETWTVESGRALVDIE